MNWMKKKQNPLLEVKLLSAGGEAEEEDEAFGFVPAISVEQLDAMNSPQDLEHNLKALNELGGPTAVVDKLGVDTSYGLSAEQVPRMSKQYGPNFIPDAPIKSIFQLLKEALLDFTLIILMIAAGKIALSALASER